MFNRITGISQDNILYILSMFKLSHIRDKLQITSSKIAHYQYVVLFDAELVVKYVANKCDFGFYVLFFLSACLGWRNKDLYRPKCYLWWRQSDRDGNERNRRCRQSRARLGSIPVSKSTTIHVTRSPRLAVPPSRACRRRRSLALAVRHRNCKSPGSREAAARNPAPCSRADVYVSRADAVDRLLRLVCWRQLQLMMCDSDEVHDKSNLLDALQVTHRPLHNTKG